MNKKALILVGFLSVFLLIMPFYFTEAASTCKSPGACVTKGTCSSTSSTAGVIAGTCDDDKECCANQVKNFDQEIAKTGLTSSLTGSIGNVGVWILSFVAIVIVAIIIIGGITWMTAMGNDQKVDTGRKMIIGAVIGMAIILASAGIYALVLQSIGAGDVEGTESDGGGGGLTGGQCYTSQNKCSADAGWWGGCVCEENIEECGAQQVYCVVID